MPPLFGWGWCGHGAMGSPICLRQGRGTRGGGAFKQDLRHGSAVSGPPRRPQKLLARCDPPGGQGSWASGAPQRRVKLPTLAPHGAPPCGNSPRRRFPPFWPPPLAGCVPPAAVPEREPPCVAPFRGRDPSSAGWAHFPEPPATKRKSKKPPWRPPPAPRPQNPGNIGGPGGSGPPLGPGLPPQPWPSTPRQGRQITQTQWPPRSPFPAPGPGQKQGRPTPRKKKFLPACPGPGPPPG